MTTKCTPGSEKLQANLWRAVGGVASGFQQVQGLVPCPACSRLFATSQSYSVEGALKPTVIPSAKRV